MMERYFILSLIALALTSCKAKHTAESHAEAKEQVQIQSERLEVVEGNSLQLVDTWQVVEVFDSLGRIRERRTTERKARTETKAQATAHTETEIKQSTQVATKHQSKSEQRAGVAPPLWLMALAFALGIALSGYIAWRWLIRR